MMASEDLVSCVMKHRFYIELAKNRSAAAQNCVSLTDERYESLVNEILNVNNLGKKHPRHYQLLKRFEVIIENDKKRLICNRTEVEDDKIIYFVADSEKFDVLHSAHLYLGHARRDQMIREIKRKYKNITRQDVVTFLDLCEPCKNKSSRFKRGFGNKRFVFDDHPNCQSDLQENEGGQESSNFGKVPKRISRVKKYQCEDKSSHTDSTTLKLENSSSAEDPKSLNQGNRENPGKHKCTADYGFNSSNVSAPNNVKSNDEVSSTVIKYILEKIDQRPALVKADPVDAFLVGIAATLKTLTPYNLNLAKTRIFTAVQELEMSQTVEQQGDSNGTHNSSANVSQPKI